MRILLLMIAVLTISFAQPSRAYELGLGISSIEEGDDRIRPGIILHGSILDLYSSRLVYYARKFGPVTERTFILSAYRHLDIFKMFRIRFLYGGLGLALMNEQTVIDIPGASESENNPNVGFTFGLHGNLPLNESAFIRASMESHLFLAGTAGILLANGRKSVISITSGVRF